MKPYARPIQIPFLFFFHDRAPAEIYTLSLHDALPISRSACRGKSPRSGPRPRRRPFPAPGRDRKSTRLNSSHVEISYDVFCLKTKKPVKGLLSNYAHNTLAVLEVL